MEKPEAPWGLPHRAAEGWESRSQSPLDGHGADIVPRNLYFPCPSEGNRLGLVDVCHRNHQPLSRLCLAVFLGYGPPSLAEGWDAIWGDSLSEEAGLVGTDGLAGFPFPMQPAPSPAPNVASARGRTCIQFDSSESGESPASSREAIDALRSLNEKHVESTILKFNVAIAESGAAMTDIETCLRSVEEGQEAATIERVWPSW